MKKAIPLLALSSSLLLGVAAASLIGCANSETETVDTTESAETETTSTDSTEAVERGSDDPVIKPGDWKQWGGTSYRNNVPVTNAKIPTDWNIGAFDRRTQEWKPENAENIKWVSQLGSQSYGNPVVADGRVYVGTNNGAGHLPRYSSRVDLGCMLCFRESDGKFLWQHSSEKLPTGRVHDWPLQGICCAPYIDGDRVYFVSSRGEVVCLDAEGFYDDEDDGEPARLERGRLFDVMPTEREGAEVTAEEINEAVAALDKGEIKPLLRTRFAKAGFELSDAVEITATRAGQTWMVKARVNGNQRAIKISKAGPKVSAFKLITTADKDEADEVWSYNMMDNLKISQHNMCSCSITALGDLLFINTSNGLDESHENLPAPSAPSFICMDKNTAEVYWTDQSPGA